MMRRKTPRRLGWLEDLRPGAVFPQPPEAAVYAGGKLTCPRCSWSRRPSTRALKSYRRHWSRKHS